MPRGETVREILVLLLACLSGCGNNIDNALTDEGLLEKFSDHEQHYKTLREMITSDAHELQIFAVADDRLGKYRLDDDGWAKQYGSYVPLEVILAEYSLTQSRYNEYLDLLSAAGASVVVRYNGSVSISISSSGFVFGGCLSQIQYDPDKIELEKPSWAQVYYQAKFSDNWGAETKCN